jgi:hypothetical protein
VRGRGLISVRTFEVDNEGNRTLLDITVGGECAHGDSLDCKGMRAQRKQRYEDWLRGILSPRQYEDHLRREVPGGRGLSSSSIE